MRHVYALLNCHCGCLKMKVFFSFFSFQQKVVKMAKIEKGWKADAVEKYCIRINKREAREKKTMVMCWYSEVNRAFFHPISNTFKSPLYSCLQPLFYSELCQHHTHYLLCAKLFISFRSLLRKSSNPFLLSPTPHNSIHSGKIVQTPTIFLVYFSVLSYPPLHHTFIACPPGLWKMGCVLKWAANIEIENFLERRWNERKMGGHTRATATLAYATKKTPGFEKAFFFEKQKNYWN